MCRSPFSSAASGGTNNIGKNVEPAVENEICEYTQMHPKSGSAAIEEGNMAIVAEFDEQSMNPKFPQSQSNARWKWPPNVLPP